MCMKIFANEDDDEIANFDHLKGNNNINQLVIMKEY
jgi:hypothetical protein